MRHLQRINLMLLLVVMILGIQNIGAGEFEREYKPAGTWSGSSQDLKSFATLDVLNGKLVPEAWQEKVRLVVTEPTLSAKGPAEVFTCDPTTYEWLLENPHHAVTMWKMLGAKCSGIEKESANNFYSREASGNNIQFHLITDRDGLKIWYAHGFGKPTALLPAIPVQAVIVLQYQDSVINKSVKHQMTIYAKTESKAASIVSKAFGSSMAGMSEKTVGQMQMFFGALPWYLMRNPERAENLLKATLITKETSKPIALKP
jgi:hypothetical protein